MTILVTYQAVLPTFYNKIAPMSSRDLSVALRFSEITTRLLKLGLLRCCLKIKRPVHKILETV